jgi:DNA-binding CsgD family transcriptional regulator
MTREVHTGGSFPRREARGPQHADPEQGLDGGLRALALAVQRLHDLVPGVEPFVQARLARAVDAVLALAASPHTPEKHGRFRPLSPREREAVSRAMLGESNKVIAYELGVSASTVGVLLHRAARKLGSRTRAELLARFREFHPPTADPALAAAHRPEAFGASALPGPAPGRGSTRVPARQGIVNPDAITQMLAPGFGVS